MPLPQAIAIGVLAQRTGCTVPTIRYYESIGLLPKAERRSGGHRTYSHSDLRRLTFIRRCRDFGFTIEQVRELVRLIDDGNRSCFDARDVAQAHLDSVREKLTELRALEKSLQAFVNTCNTACAGGPAPNCSVLEDLARPESPATR